jgi:cell division protein FtsN
MSHIKKLKMKQFKLIAITLLSVLIVSCASLQRKGTSSFDDSSSPYVKDETTTSSSGTTNNKTSQTNKNQTSNTGNIVVREEKIKVIDTETDKTNYKYYVIIGSFRIIENARNYKSQLIDEGFTPVILENEAGLFRISVKSGNDEQTARNEIANIRNKFSQHNDVWLLISKK